MLRHTLELMTILIAFNALGQSSLLTKVSMSRSVSLSVRHLSKITHAQVQNLFFFNFSFREP